MNSGIADAQNPVRHLTAALRDDIPARLNGYAHDRRSAALTNVAATSKALRAMEPPTPVHRAVRYFALVAAPWSDRARSYVDSGPYAPNQEARVTATSESVLSPKPVRGA